MSDTLETRESFLRAIVAAPADDTPKLIFADHLEELGETDLAALIRAGVARPRTDDVGEYGERAAKLFNLAKPLGHDWSLWQSGFPDRGTIEVDAGLLADPTEFRRVAAFDHPEWFAADTLKVTGGLMTGAVQIDAMLTAPATANVTKFDLGGLVFELPLKLPDVLDPPGYSLTDFEYRPVMTLLAVEALTQHRAARRIVELKLTNNMLDNDAARLVERSTTLLRLEKLEFFDGNSVRGDTWARLLARFGEAVVS